MAPTTDRAPITITDADVATYHDRGYWCSPRLFNDEEIAVIRHEIERICLRDERDTDNWNWGGSRDWSNHKPTQVRQVTNAWWQNLGIRRAVLKPVIGYIGARLMGSPEARMWHDQVIYKPPSAGAEDRDGNVGWHQDYAHWQCSSTSNMCTAWVALQDTDLSNGGMRTIVGSHKWGLQEDAYTFGEKDLHGLQARFAKGRPWIDEPCVLKAGEASFHNALTFHGSGPNLSGKPRLNFIVHMMPAGCALHTGPGARYHLNATMLGPFARAGTPFAGPLFPRLWPPEPDFPLTLEDNYAVFGKR
ncbi:MAG: phytanoyl-CoA dioxygenase family protein [Planctomycetes bacterium]|nr:phytanoyl-CoA dioxygenase family protein [Planctomycetota bacterium]